MDDAGEIGVSNMYGGYKSIHSEVWRKAFLVDRHRRFLDMDHTCRRNRYGFRKNTIDSKEAPVITSQQIWERVRQLPKIAVVRKSVRLPSYKVEYNWTKQSKL